MRMCSRQFMNKDSLNYLDDRPPEEDLPRPDDPLDFDAVEDLPAGPPPLRDLEEEPPRDEAAFAVAVPRDVFLEAGEPGREPARPLCLEEPDSPLALWFILLSAISVNSSSASYSSSNVS